MPFRFSAVSLALAVLAAVPAVSAQGGLTATPNPYDASSGPPLVIRNTTAAAVRFDSLRTAATLSDNPGGPTGPPVYVSYYSVREGDQMYGSVYCAWNGPCRDYGSLFGLTLAPGDSVLIQTTLACPVRPSGRAAGGFRDTLRVYSGGVTEPLQVRITELFCVASEAAPDASAVRLALAPNPAGGVSTLSLVQPAAGPVRVVVSDALGREVAVLHDGLAGATLGLRVDTSAWPAGVYVVRAEAGEGHISARLVVAR
ncbi:MAG TPA: T9SS type A sorting domain-containing protein [Rubricoccaceae bacterium]|jgi:hypothetical protein